jgi:4-amino-4-deoxy-L-arabinose transferase-like glycosyltransferase
MTRNTVTVILIGIIIIAAGLRFYGLDKQSLWYDETFEETAFQRQFLGFKTFLTPTTPPLHSFFINLIKQKFPLNDFALRTPACIFGLLSVPLLFFLGRKLFNEKVGIIASFLLAISPFHIWYSQEARMYTLQWMLALISLIFFMRAIEKPGIVNYTCLVVSTVLGLYTHQLSLSLLIIMSIFLLLFLRKYNSKYSAWIAVLCAVIILYSPWIVYQLSSLMNKSASYQKEINLSIYIPYTFYTYFAGFSIGPSLRELHIERSIHAIKPYLPVIGSFMAVYGVLFSMGLWSLRKDPPKLLILVFLSTVPIFFLVFLIYAVDHKLSYNVRYTGIALIGCILLIAKGIESVRYICSETAGKILAVLSIIAIAGFSYYSYFNYQFEKRYHKEDIRSAVEYINKNKTDNDVILIITSISVATFNRYSDKYSFRSVGFPPPPFNTGNRKEVESELIKMTNDKNKLWLLLSQEWNEKELVSYTKTWLDANYIEFKELRKGIYDIANVQIFCYDLTRHKSPLNDAYSIVVY